jgi:hypothetical protein
VGPTDEPDSIKRSENAVDSNRDIQISYNHIMHCKVFCEESSSIDEERNPSLLENP